jgi:hypothetical protein
VAVSEKEAVVVTRRESILEIETLLERMRALGVAAEWHFRLDSERDDPSEWSSGYFTPPGRKNPEVGVSNEPLDESDRDDLVALCRKKGIGESESAILAATTLRYEVEGSGESGARTGSLFDAVALAIAELGDGIVVVRRPWGVFTPAAYRTHASLG